jgi:hypothetical protein
VRRQPHELMSPAACSSTKSFERRRRSSPSSLPPSSCERDAAPASSSACCRSLQALVSREWPLSLRFFSRGAEPRLPTAPTARTTSPPGVSSSLSSARS